MRLSILGLALLAVGPSWAGDVTVKDGVTIAVDGATFRLDGIDAPEADQFCLNEKGAVSGSEIEARDRLKTLLAGRAVHCEDKGPDPVYPKRRIGVCRIDGDATTLNQWLVRQGWAVKFEPYAKGRFAADEDEAKASRAGLWKGCFANPQDLRRWNKSTAKLLGASCSSDSRHRCTKCSLSGRSEHAPWLLDQRQIRCAREADRSPRGPWSDMEKALR